MTPPDTPDPSNETPLAARIVPALFRSRNVLWDNDHRIVEAHGVTWSQFVTLIILQGAKPEFVLSPTQLCSAVQVTSGGMTKMLHGLEDAGFVARLENPEDKRSRLVRLTKSGDQQARVISKELVTQNQEIIRGILSDEDAGRLADLLMKLNHGLQNMTS